MVLFLFSLCDMSDLWPYQRCLKVCSVLPMYVFVVLFVVIVALYTTASCKQFPSRGHSVCLWQLHVLLFVVVALFLLARIFLLCPDIIVPMFGDVL